MAFVLVQHLDPDHESALTLLLGRTTAMPVREVTDGMRVKPNHVYVIPPGRMLAFSRGALKLQARPPTRGLPHSIDFLFDSLARDQMAGAIGVILSGTATDGTFGLEAIKAEGGITFAQDDTAKYDSMPRSAIAAGCVDFVLSPQGIAAELARLARHPYIQGHAAAELADATVPVLPPFAPADPEGAQTGYARILLLLRNRFRTDFSLYKPSTIQRRITRRMLLGRHETMAAYSGVLRRTESELNALYGDLLIGVTSFFRNPEAFAALKEGALSRIVQPHPVDPIRVWVPGCSSGQEAYSLAMTLVEFAEQTTGTTPAIQIFGTDLNEAMLSRARHGFYPKNLVLDLSPERLRRFFVEEPGGYRVSKVLRDACVFAHHNLIGDPPFSRMDLISCRNLLIYLGPQLQKNILSAFHYALQPAGVLLLGASESIGTLTDLFATLDKKQKIYGRKTAAVRTLPINFIPRHPALPKKSDTLKAGVPAATLPGGLNAEREADRVALSQYAPPGILIDANLKIIQFRGGTGPYLQPPSGKAEFHVLKMAREGVMLPLRAAIEQARKEQRPVRRQNVPVAGDGPSRLVTIGVTPLKNLRELCYLISFEEPGHPSARRMAVEEEPTASKAAGRRPPAADRTRAESRLNASLELELAETRDYVQSLQEQHEAANEEIQASSEELQSGNEELQSINEELQTSKEELESTNEELITVNDEMTHRNAELTRLNSDLSNVTVSLNTAIVVVGRDLTLWSFTPSAEKLFNLLPTDVGRPIAGIRHNLDFPGLEPLIAEVIDHIAVREHEVQDKSGHWYLLRVRPYLTVDRKITGAVLVLFDIDALKQSERTAARALDYAEAILRTARDPLVILHADLRVKTANEAFYKTFQTNPEETEGRLFFQLGNGQWQNPRLHELLEEVLPRKKVFNEFEIVHDFPALGRRTMLLNFRQLDTETATQLILLSIEDVTERQRTHAAMQQSELRYRRLFEAAQDGIMSVDPATRKITDANPFMIDLLGYERAELLGRELWEIGLLTDEAASRSAFRVLKQKGFIHYEDLPLESKQGRRREVEFVGNLYDEGGHKLIQCNIRDITERKQAETALRESEARLHAVLEQLPVGVSLIGRDGCTVLLNQIMHRFMPGGLPSRDPERMGRWRALKPDGTPLEIHQWPGARALRGETVLPGIEFRFIDDDGVERWTSVATAPLRSAAGTIVGAVVMVQDIDERKRAESALHLANHDLQAAQNAAEHASRAKDDFLAALSHELRTPLTPVLMAAAALREDERLPADARAELGMMERNIALEARLIDDLLDLTALSRGKLQLHSQSCDAHSLIGLAIDIVREDARTKGVAIERAFTARHSGLIADPARFQQIIWNLLRNAVKFTPTGGRISISTREENNAEGVNCLHIEVADTGIGIDPTQLERIFQPFDQGALKGGHRFGGLGLGLAIARAVVDLHGGRITALSAGVNRGATFVIELPGAVAFESGDHDTASPFVEAPTGSASPLPPASPPVAPLRLLLVEDHVSTLQTISRLLRRDGHHVVTATTMAAALAAAAADPFDLVISDLGLPDGSGTELMEKLRDEYGLQGIALSGYGMEEDLIRSRAAGFFMHLVKPVSMAELRRVIADLPPAAR